MIDDEVAREVPALLAGLAQRGRQALIERYARAVELGEDPHAAAKLAAAQGLATRSWHVVGEPADHAAPALRVGPFAACPGAERIADKLAPGRPFHAARIVPARSRAHLDPSAVPEPGDLDGLRAMIATAVGLGATASAARAGAFALVYNRHGHGWAEAMFQGLGEPAPVHLSRTPPSGRNPS